MCLNSSLSQTDIFDAILIFGNIYSRGKVIKVQQTEIFTDHACLSVYSMILSAWSFGDTPCQKAQSGKDHRKNQPGRRPHTTPLIGGSKGCHWHIDSGSNFFFIFKQFLGKIKQNNRLASPPLRLAPHPVGNSGSATAVPHLVRFRMVITVTWGTVTGRGGGR